MSIDTNKFNCLKRKFYNDFLNVQYSIIFILWFRNKINPKYNLKFNLYDDYNFNTSTNIFRLVVYLFHEWSSFSTIIFIEDIDLNLETSQVLGYSICYMFTIKRKDKLQIQMPGSPKSVRSVVLKCLHLIHKFSILITIFENTYIPFVIIPVFC